MTGLAPAPTPLGPTPPGPMVPHRYRVAWRRQDLADTTTLGLVPVDAAIAPPAPGQYTMLWAPGVGEVPISVSGLPGPDGAIEQTIRAVGPATTALAGCDAGAVLGVRGPFGAGWDLDAAAGGDVVVVAGGLGMAPLRPVVTHLLAERDRFGRVALVVGARSPDALLYADQLEAWRGRFDLDVAVTVDAATRAWHGEVGVVTRLLGRVPVDWERSTAFVCGPEVMMRFAAAGVIERGVPAARVQVSLERNMRCGIGHCGHCQLGPFFLCSDGPVVPYAAVEQVLRVRER